MKRFNFLIIGNKAVMTAVFFLFCGLAFAKPAKKNASKADIDFAFPQTVIADSETKLNKALKQNQPVQTLEALINLTVARNLISNENAPDQLKMIDSVATILPSPYNATAYMLKAEILRQMYFSRRGTYNTRENALSIENSNPTLWDYSQFQEAIMNLTDKSLALSSEAQDISLAQMKPLFTFYGTDDRIKFNEDEFTLLDFLVYKTISLRENFSPKKQIPFYNPSTGNSSSSLQLVDRLITIHSQNPQALAYAILKKYSLLDGEKKKDFLTTEINRLKDNPAVVPLVYTEFTDYISSCFQSEKDLDKIKDFYELASETYSKFSSEITAVVLKSILDFLTAPEVKLQIPSPVQTNNDFTINYSTINVNDFYILVYKCDSYTENDIRIRDIEKFCKKVNAIPVQSAGEKPFFAADSIKISLEKPGEYCFFVSTTNNVDGIISTDDRIYLNPIHVSDIDLITMQGTTEKNTGVYVVNSADGKPIEDASVKYENTASRRGNKETKTEKTDKSGWSSTPFRGAYVKASFKGSTASTYLHYYEENSKSAVKTIRLLTDLPIYHPGDTLQFAGIVFEKNGLDGKVIDNQEVKISLFDANYQTKDTVSLVSDNLGRITGSFIIPKDGLRGNWTIRAIEKEFEYSSTGFKVEDYKTPTFFVTLDKKEGDSAFISFEGNASTYSGMPLGGVPVNYTVNYYNRSLWWRNSEPGQNFMSTTETDSDGNFQIKLPLENLDIKEYNGIFSIYATVTDTGGETEESNTVCFWLKSGFQIQADIKDKTEIKGENVKFHVAVSDLLGQPVIKECLYTIKNNSGKELISGKFDSPDLTLSTKELPSGSYTISISLAEDEDSKTDYATIFYRASEVVPPVESVLWIPELRYSIANQNKPVNIAYGSSFNNQYILVTVKTRDGKHKSEWLKSDGKITSYPITLSPGEESKTVVFTAYRNHKFIQQEVTVVSEEASAPLEIEVNSFRSTATPGDFEKWDIKVSKYGKPLEAGLIGVMYDKALESITPLNWPSQLFAPQLFRNVYTSGDNQFGHSLSYRVYSPLVYINFTPEISFFTHGYPLYAMGNGGIHEAKRVMKASSRTTSMAQSSMEMAVAEEAAYDLAAPAYAAGKLEGANDAGETGFVNEFESDANFRPAEMPLAFFRPMLQTGKDGQTSLDFEVPNFNTTWNIKLFAYTPELASNVKNLEMTVSKKIMVRLATPRFLRTGDDATLVLRVYNNDSIVVPAKGKVEIFNPLTGETLSVAEFSQLIIEPSANKTVSLPYHCPENLNVIGVRGLGKTGNYSDGEETFIPILPSTTPVIDSYPFYLKDDEKELLVKLPEFTSKGTFTLTYCDNPAWEALTALPALMDGDSKCLTWKLQDFYASSVASGLLENYPELRAGLSEIVNGEAADSLLVSRLEKDADLKIVALDNTPWVNNAQSENIRLSMLGKYLDEKEVKNVLDKLWKDILSYQNSDGGFAWLPDSRSSYYTTSRFVSVMSKLKDANYLSSDKQAQKSIERAIKYCDNEISTQYKKLKKPTGEFYYGLLSYLISRRSFNVAFSDKQFEKIFKEAIKEYNSGWKKRSINEKALMAILLADNGYEMTAREILESLRQYASEDAVWGMWYDNIGSELYGSVKQTVTSNVINAFQRILPGNESIDKMRRWLLLQLQVQDWQEGNASVDAINTLLTTGKKWTGKAEKPEIRIGDKLIPYDNFISPAGYLKVNLDYDEIADQTLSIRRDSSSPAWGAVINQYIAPITSVSEKGVSDLKITKIYSVIESDGSFREISPADEIEVGEKLRITVILENSRDMDYVVLADEFAACLQPCSQLSGYMQNDNMFAYQEIRKSSVNYFIEYLPKGSHLIVTEYFVTTKGDFVSGISTVQSQLAPSETAHSAGRKLTVGN